MEEKKGMDMALGERLRLLRNERAWSQAELAEKVEADARRISLYENGHITPSVEALIRIAQAFDVSIDYLLLDEIPRRPLKIEDQVLLERLQDIQLLSKQDKASLIHILDALIARNKLKTLAREL